MSNREILRFIILAAVFATPFVCLYVADSMFFPFISGKNFLFRILVEVMLGAWLLLMFIDSAYRPRFSWILGAAGAFLLVLAVADSLGVNPSRSVWSNYERMEGLVAHIHLFLYFLIAGSVMQTEKLWQWFWRTSLGVSMIVVLHAFSQLAGRADIHQSATRLDASFGNATYLAIYAFFHIFLAAFLYAREEGRNAYRWIYLVIGAVNFVVLYFTQTRGALLGVIGGSFLAFLLVAFFDRERPRFRKYALGGVAGLIVLVGGFIMFRDAAWIQNSPTLARMASISLSDPTTQSRFLIWNMSWEGFKERPILGWGQDNFLYVFSQHYNPMMWNQEPWFDRSHNVFFDWMIAGGTLGILAYLSLFGAALYYLWFARKKHFSVIERSILTGMLAGYFVHNIFVFDNLTSYIFFFGILSYLHFFQAHDSAIKEAKVDHKKSEEPEASDLAIVGVIILVLTIGLIYAVNIRNINANVALIEAIRPEGVLIDDGKGGKKIALEEVVGRGFIGTTEAWEQLAQTAMQAADPRVPEDLRNKFYQLTAAEFDSALAEDPNNVRTLSFAAAFYTRFGEYEKALESYEKAIPLSPKRQALYIDMGLLQTSLGNLEAGEEATRIAYELAPAFPDAGVAYAAALIYNKKLDEAQVIIESLPASHKYDPRIINAYGNNNHFAPIISLLNEKIATGQATGLDYLSLGASYSESGRKQEAVAAIEKAMSIDSSMKEQGEEFIRQIRAGQ